MIGRAGAGRRVRFTQAGEDPFRDRLLFTLFQQMQRAGREQDRARSALGFRIADQLTVFARFQDRPLHLQCSGVLVQIAPL